MTIQRRFILFFTGFTLLIALVISALSIGFLKEAYDRILHAANTTYLPIMASHMFVKATLTFALISFVVVIVSIPLGILLSQWLSAPYLRIFKNLSEIAQKRLRLDKKTDLGNNERIILEKYLGVLLDDFNKLKEYEKEKSWKDGARILMHELKNPLTPLKLSSQSLASGLNNPEIIQEEISRILTAIKDIEKILFCFKELVNIEFEPLSKIDMKEHVRALYEQMKISAFFSITYPENDNPFYVLSEPAIVKMLFVNLVNNGISENPEEFHVAVYEVDNLLTVDFITPHRRLYNTAKIFRLGYSTKGNDRGFGLFLCKKISDYLNLNIRFKNENNDVVFSVDFIRYEVDEHRNVLK